MRKIFIQLLIALTVSTCFGQDLKELTVEKIMRDPRWIGSSPSNPYWSADGKYLFFNWNPDKSDNDSLYYITLGDNTPKKADYELRQNTLNAQAPTYNRKRTAYVYAKSGDVFYKDLKSNRTKMITQTVEFESNPQFINNDTRIVYTRNQNLYAFDLADGTTVQLTNIVRGNAGNEAPSRGPQNRGAARETTAGNAQEKALKKEQLDLFEVLRERKTDRDKSDRWTKAQPKAKSLRTISIDDKTLSGLNISPDGRYVTYRLFKAATGATNTIIPNFVTESGFTTDIPGRTKVGAPMGTFEFFIFDTQKDTVLQVRTNDIPGINDLPDYTKDYPARDTAKRKTARGVTFNGPFWSPTGKYGVLDVRSQDNKDRWLMQLDGEGGKLTLLDRQRDEAWIGGPGVSFSFGGASDQWLDDDNFWFQSEATGYSQLYVVNVSTKQKTAITSGNFEVQRTQLSANKKHFYITTNEVHPGEQHLYRVSVAGGKREKLTSLAGANQVSISPDEKSFAFLHSYSNKPWELYVQQVKAGSAPTQITTLAQSPEFASYKWREPEVVTFTAGDGATVYARLYKPAKAHTSSPAVVFVHGAGYLQNAHKWWSSYFREYMFHNLLADQGYTVLDIDYRGSAGYGRDVRTGIYRFMGGKDLDDHVDGAKYLVEKHGVNPKRIGIYGGSYGGFITLMAMFTKPGTFEAGAALRSVTDWAHYNHGYTSNILNEPFTDSIAYRRSSPIYYAEGLQGHLLMCHGMVDVNVHFQDIVRLSQRLIELKKDNWELAVYPVEDHGFVEPSSWTDEYKRILKLFELQLKKP
ncbi:MAG: S9 family peptidase [Chitinophagaceae bacterium]|nr:MAG: S9 family peptidase [Chitinophagaceae bacterium]